jgi:hypothetical protein
LNKIDHSSSSTIFAGSSAVPAPRAPKRPYRTVHTASPSRRLTSVHTPPSDAIHSVPSIVTDPPLGFRTVTTSSAARVTVCYSAAAVLIGRTVRVSSSAPS